ncbi:Mis12-domain-containing protein, partial [Fistulina hepatica ATCC 64428]
IPPMLLPEALGFVPQLLLDDITNIATIAVDDGIQAVEGFLQNWSDSRQSDGANDENWESIQEETENGLVAFTTLLEFHLDNSFDFFGAWCLRNIFAIPPDLPYVLPHHAGLDLTMTPQREQELMDEIESLRSKIENQKRVRRLYKRAILKARAQRRRVERRAEQLSFLSGPTLDTLLSLPDKVKIMQTSIRDLRDVDVSGVLQRLQTTDPGKRQWESPEGFY